MALYNSGWGGGRKIITKTEIVDLSVKPYYRDIEHFPTDSSLRNIRAFFEYKEGPILIDSSNPIFVCLSNSYKNVDKGFVKASFLNRPNVGHSIETDAVSNQGVISLVSGARWTPNYSSVVLSVPEDRPNRLVFEFMRAPSAKSIMEDWLVFINRDGVATNNSNSTASTQLYLAVAAVT